MKTLMIVGGMVGFLIGIGFGIAQQGDWPSVFWKACLVAYASGLLMRWWGRIWIKCIHESYRDKLAEHEHEEEEHSSTLSTESQS